MYSDSYKKQNSGKIIFFFVIFFSLLPFRDSFFFNELPGNLGDARWSVAVFENWFQFFTHLDNPFNLNYFYPLKNTLGFAEGYLLQGIFHSALRFVGLNLIDAWIYSNIIFYLIGNIAIYFVFRRYITNKLLLCAAIFLISNSATIIAAWGHNQVYGFYWTFFILNSWLALTKSKLSLKKQKTHLIVILTFPPLLCFSSWYGIYLFTFLALIFIFYTFLFSNKKSKSTTENLLYNVKGSAKYFCLILLSSIIMFATFISVYYPLSKEAFRPWEELNFYSPRLIDFFNSNALKGNFLNFIFERFKIAPHLNSERALAIPTATSVVFFLTILFFIRQILYKTNKININPKENNLLAKLILTVFTYWTLVIADDSKFSLWYLVWKILPAAHSIRAPFRANILIFIIIVFVIFLIFDKLINLNNIKLRISIYLVCFLLIIDQYRIIPNDWKKNELLPMNVVSEISVIKNCDVFYINYKSDLPRYMTDIDAIILSTITKTPTVNGYGGFWPKEYPYELNSSSVKSWFEYNGYNLNMNRVCELKNLR